MQRAAPRASSTGGGRRRRWSGYVLVPVVLGLSLIALVGLMLSNESALGTAESGGLLDPVEAEHLAHSGLERAVWRATHGACGGDFTIASTALGRGDYAASTSGSASATRYTLSVDRDAWIRNDDPDRNNGNTSWNHLRSELGKVEQILTRFDLRALPANARISSAIAWFHVKSLKPHPEGPIAVHPITADWDELSVTWNSFDAQYASGRLARIPAQDAGDVWVGINLTAQVQSWVNGEPNFGLLLEATAEGTHTEYTGRADGTSPPRLEVVVGNGPASPLEIVATGRVPDGVSRSVRRSLTPAYQPPNDMTLQLGIDGGADTEINNFYPRNYGGATYFEINASPGYLQRLLLRFDLSSVPVGASIRSARLELRLLSLNTPGSASAHRVTRSWVEGTRAGGGTPDGATWSTHDGSNSWTSAGGDFDTSIVAETAIASSDTWVAWEIAPLVEAWLAGESNYGVLIQSEGALRDASFASRENSTAGFQPRLSIRYACECGSPCLAPSGSGSVLMVIGDSPASPSADDELILEMLEGWGYGVTLIQDDDSAGNFAAAAGAADVVFVSESVSSGNVGTKLTSLSTGVVSAELLLNDELGIATSGASPTGDSVDVVDTSHYITSIFDAGTLPFKTEVTALASVGGTVSPDAQVLAEIGGVGGLVALESGAVSVGGGGVAGRRVLVPVGEANVPWSYLTGEGRLVVQRALAWAGGSGTPVAGKDVLLVVGTTSPLSSKDQGRKDLMEIWGHTVALIDDSESQANFDTAMAAADVVYVSPTIGGGALADKATGTPTPVVNEFAGKLDNFGFSSSTASTVSADNFSATNALHYITEPYVGAPVTIFSASLTMPVPGGTVAPDLENVGEVSGTPALVTLDVGRQRWDGDPAPARRAHLPFRNAETTQLTSAGEILMQRAIVWAATAPPNLGPLAHWKLDDGIGTLAVDSEGGHDGTLTNNPTWVAGLLGDALDFDGSNDYISVPHDDGLSLTSFSISAWIYPNALSGWQVFVNKGTTTSAVNYYLSTNGDEIGLGFYNAGWVEFNSTSANLSTGEWFHVAATYEDSTRTGTIYLDGAPIFTDTVGKSPLPNNEALTIGRSGFGEYWSGTLDDVRIYDRSLSGAEMADLAAGGAGGGPGSSPTFESFEETIDADNDTAAISVNKPAGTATGELLIAVVVTNRNNESTLVADDAGWNLLTVDAQASSSTTGVWWRLAGASEPASYGFSWDAAAPARSYSWIMRFTGNDPTSPINVWDKFGECCSMSPLSPTVTTTVDDTLILRIGGFDDDDITIGDPGMAGHTPITMQKSNTGTGTVSGGAAYVVQTASGNSGTANFTLTNTEQSRTITIGIAPAP